MGSCQKTSRGGRSRREDGSDCAQPSSPITRATNPHTSIHPSDFPPAPPPCARPGRTLQRVSHHLGHGGQVHSHAWTPTPPCQGEVARGQGGVWTRGVPTSAHGRAPCPGSEPGSHREGSDKLTPGGPACVASSHAHPVQEAPGWLPTRHEGPAAGPRAEPGARACPRPAPRCLGAQGGRGSGNGVSPVLPTRDALNAHGILREVQPSPPSYGEGN